MAERKPEPVRRPGCRTRLKDVAFIDEISVMDDVLSFYVDPKLNVDELLGIHVEATEDDDDVSVYAEYDRKRREVRDALAVILWRNTGDLELSCFLYPEEQAMLRSKMEAYCQQREGMSLDTFCDAMDAEEETLDGASLAELLERGGLEPGRFLIHEDRENLAVPVEALTELTEWGRQDFAVLLNATVKAVRPMERGVALVLDGVDAGELETLGKVWSDYAAGETPMQTQGI